jgi:tRNA(fMet)-specific endonuclease VapC
MVRYVLDSDHISLFTGYHQPTRDRISREIANCAITIVSVQEVFNGWVGRLGKPNTEAEFIKVYTGLYASAQFFQEVELLNYDASASAMYEQLMRNHPTLNRQPIRRDMRIAAIALSLGATVVTRNRKDFGLVSGLKIEDWSV